MDLQNLYNRFKNQEDCIRLLEAALWNGKPQCPYCKNFRHTAMPKENRYHCGICKVSYSITAKSMFHKTKLDLQKWFYAIAVVIETDISARQLAKDLNVTKDTACFMKTKIRINRQQAELIKLNIK